MRLILLLIPTYGGSVFNDDKTEVMVDSPAGVKALQWIADWVDHYGGMDAVERFSAGFGEWLAQDPFFTSQIAMHQQGDFFLTYMKKYAPELNFKVAPLPIPEGGVTVNFSSGWGWSIPRGSKNPDDALKWLGFCAKPEEMAQTLESIPIMENAISEFLQDKKPIWKDFAKIVEGFKDAPFTGCLGVLNTSKYYSIAHKYLQEVIYKRLPVEEAIRKMDAEMQAVLEGG